MNARQLITTAVVAVLLIGGVAALGATSPTDQANDDGIDDHAPADEIDASEAGDDRSSGGLGPSDGLPAQVPDHVSGILDRIGSFLDGSIDHLGQSLSDLLGDDAAEDATDGTQAGDGPTDDGENDQAESDA